MTSSLIPGPQAQKILKWLAGALGAGALAASPVVFGYALNITTRAEVDETVQAKISEFDHGRPRPLPEEKWVDPPNEGMAAAIQRSKDDIASLKQQQKQTEQIRKLVVDLYRYLVRQQAADAEADRRRRAESARKAVQDFDRAVANGVEPDEAARRALEVNPYR